MRGGDTLYICVAASYFVFMEVIKMNQKEFLDEIEKKLGYKVRIVADTKGE